MSGILWSLFGKGAIKAIAGGIGAAATTVGATAMGACDLDSIGKQVGAAVGAFVIGHAITWLSPANK